MVNLKNKNLTEKTTTASVIVALQCIFPLDCVAFPTKEDAFFFFFKLTFKGQCHVLRNFSHHFTILIISFEVLDF